MMAALRTIGHQVWTDTRGLALFVVAWGLVLTAQAVVVVLGPTEWAPVPGTPYRPDYVVAVMRVIMTVVLTVMAVHRDAAIGTTAFWRTRPIDGTTMWASKVVWIGLWLVVAPAVAGSVLMGALGLAAEDAAHAGLLVALEQAILVGPALMAAAVTDTLPHFIVAGFSGLAAFVALGTVLDRPVRALLPRIEVAALWRPQDVLTAFWFLGGIVVLAIVYLSRRVAVAVALSVVLLLSAVVSLAAITWNVPYQTPRLARGPMAHSDDISVEVVPQSMRVNSVVTGSGRDGSFQARMRVSLDVSGAPPDMIVSVASVRSRLHVSNEGDIPWESASVAGQSAAGRATGESQPFRSMRVALGGSDLVLPADAIAQVPDATLTGIPDTTRQRIALQEASLDADVTLRAYRYNVAARLPLEPGAIVRVDQARLVFVSAIINTARVFVTLRGPTINRFWRQGSYLGNFVALHNPGKRQGVFRTQIRSSSAPLTFLNLFERAGVETRTYEFTPGAGSLSRLGVDERWLADAELVFFGTEELGTLTRHLRLTGLKLGAPPGSQPAP